MGIIRLLLAIAVVLTHAGPIYGLTYIDGLIAVQSFFIISGFYMSLILNEKYNQEKSYKLFISNRLLRLFPAYIFIIIISFIGTYLSHNPIISDFSRVNIFSKIYLIVINIIIVGQDTTLFLGLDAKGSLHYVKHFYNSNPQIHYFMLCPQAWSLSLELMFYSIAPFLVRRKLSIVLVIMALLFILRMVIYSQGMYYDPWTYRFFPTELFFFLSGNVAYRIYKKLTLLSDPKIETARKAGLAMLSCIVIFLFWFNYCPVNYIIKQYAFYIFLTFSIPFIFLYTKGFSTDKFIGELSYPVYITHLFVMAFCVPFAEKVIYHFSTSKDKHWIYYLESTLAVVISLVFSYLVVIVLIKRIDDFREKRVEKYRKRMKFS
ncbi:MAG TPA: acyltransferase [Bacteroidia bacterium]|nr:acyltransferase [Bacteroidia bacterium]